MNSDDVIEKMLEPLYLNVSGDTLDRIRFQVHRFLTTKVEFKPDMLYIGCLGEDYEIAFCPYYSDVLELEKDPEIKGIVDKVPPASLASVASLAASEYCSYKNRVRMEEVSLDPRLDIISLAALRLYTLQRGAFEFQPGKIPMMAVVSYTDLQKKDKAVFVALWKKASQPN